MFSEAFATFQEYFVELIQPKTLISAGAFLALAVIFIVISKNSKFNTRTLAYGALAISAAFVLSYIRIFKMPTGGTISLASMLPIFIFAYIAGTRAGLMAGMCYGILQFIQDPVFAHPVQFLLDYPIAFAVLGLAGIAGSNFYMGAVVGSTARFICHYLSGVIFFGSYAPEGQSVFLYSLIYNSSYMIPDMLICLVLLWVPSIRAAIRRVSAAGC